MTKRKEGRGRETNKQFFILFHLILLTVTMGSSLLLTYFFIIPYDELREQTEVGMELSSKISQIQISMSADALKEKINPLDILDLKNQISTLNSELEVLKLANLEHQMRFEGQQEILAEQSARLSKLTEDCITGLRLGAVQWTPINGGHGYKDEYGYVITGLINYSFDDSADQVHRRKFEKHVNGTWSGI